MLAASGATFFALLSHVVAGGVMPGWVGVAVPWVLAVAVSTLLTGRKLALWRLSLAVLASQFLFHGLFVLGLFGAEASTTPPGLHDHHLTAWSHSAPVGVVHADLSMWAGHALAAVATIVVVYRGEVTVRRALSVASDIFAALSHRLVTVISDLTPAPRRVFARASVIRRVLAPLGWYPSTVARRGPPPLRVV